MERNRFRTSNLIRTGALVGLLALAPLTGCSSKVDEARLAYADGEGNLDEAERLYREAMKDPGWEELARDELFDMFMIEGEKQADAKKYKRAEEAYRSAVELKPTDSEALTGLVESLSDLMRYDEALEEARKGAGAGCRNCRRLMAVLLIRRADGQMQAGNWAAAEQDYVDAYAVLPDAAVALGIVRARYARKDVEGAAKALMDAADLIGANDLQARNQFLELRRAVVLMALESDKVPLADELLDRAPTGVGPETQLGLAMEVAMALRKQGKPDVALSRMMALVDAAAQGKLRITEEQTAQLRDKVATLYGARAAKSLTEGDIESAEKDLENARGIKPDDPSFALQAVLITAGKGKVVKAESELTRVASDAKGHAQVKAILHAMKAYALIGDGKYKEAREEIKRAEASATDLPEVHIAMAQMLAVTPVSGLSKSEEAEIAKSGLVPYPGGKVMRVAEALSELDWSRQQIRGLGVTYPYRAPGTTQRIEQLESDLKRNFPYTVKFQREPTTVLVLENSGSGAMKVDVTGAENADSAEIPAGGTVRLTIDKPGFVRMSYRGTTATWVAEPYTEVQLKL